jgi:hypothetical protein
MLDEFEDDSEVEHLPIGAARGPANGAARPRVARLVSRLYGAASAPLRSRMLACLLRPLGSLGLVAVASGAFARLVYRGGEAGAGMSIGDLASYSSDQVFELARFVEQVSPDAIQQVAGLLADNAAGASAFTAAVAMLLVRAVRGIPPSKTSSGHGSATALEELVRRRAEKPAPDPIPASSPD